jgi:hypothetical protein
MGGLQEQAIDEIIRDGDAACTIEGSVEVVLSVLNDITQ